MHALSWSQEGGGVGQARDFAKNRVGYFSSFVSDFAKNRAFFEFRERFCQKWSIFQVLTAILSSIHPNTKQVNCSG